MEHSNFKIRYNVMKLSSLSAFTNIKGGMNCNCKDVYFVRAVGANGTLATDVETMDRVLSEKMLTGQGRYQRVDKLPVLVQQSDIAYYSTCYERWLQNDEKNAVIRKTENNVELQQVLGEACSIMLEAFHKCTPNASPSMNKNLIVKVLYWFDSVCAEIIDGWDMRQSVKIVMSNIQTKHEYMFSYLLTQVGMDVLLLQYEKDIDSQIEQMNLSDKIELGNYSACNLTFYHGANDQIQEPQAVEEPVVVQSRPIVHIPERNRRMHSSQQNYTERNRDRRIPEERIRNSMAGAGNTVVLPQDSGRRELAFEELALLASSVVMIAIHDRRGEVIGTGSGIMIGRDGYILTNNHVANGGVFYSVRIEDEEEIYKTDEVIKYNPVLDLAIIRISRTLRPLPIYKGNKKLVRGQKVVAIGSPLGLFNSVSDGIISGFRQIDHVDMIQFTAPISHGSSGGAVLNMFGEVIGISTAGIDSGQNINLAVGYENINSFARGFL